MYVITGATGHTGKPIALALLAAGKAVRVISRSAEKAKDLTDKGAELCIGETSDVEFLTKAFEGATAVYAMIPMEWTAPDYTKHQQKHADAIAAALAHNKVPYVVSLSSVGTHLDSGSGLVLGLRYAEQKYDAIPGLNRLHLRPTYFMENVLVQADVIKNMDIMGSPVSGSLTMNAIATQDIAAYAAKRLLALDFAGRNIQYLLGQRDITYNEIAGVLGKEIGKPDLKYVEFGYEDFKKSFLQMGASESVADNMNIFIKAMNEGKILSDAQRDASSTTPTSIEEFAKTFSYVYNLK